MNQTYFIELASSAQGHLKRIHITPRLLKGTAFGAALLGLFITGLMVACLCMSWKLADYYHVQRELQTLRGRYSELQTQATQGKQQMASLEKFATEMSAAYGLPNRSDAGTGHETLENYNFLKAADYSGLYHEYAHQWQSQAQPSAWPLAGVLRSSFGEREDPFSGEGAFHTGIDLAVPKGTVVRATGDGVVISAGWSGHSGYGNLVVIDHGNHVETYYAHLSECLVVPGEEVRKGEQIALSGGTGHATGPHLHYEVRVAGIPVNPYRYLPKVQLASSKHATHDDLGL